MISFTIVSRFYITSKHNLINVRTIFMKPNWYKKVTNIKFGKMTWPGNIIDVSSLNCYSVRLHNSMLSLKVTDFFYQCFEFSSQFRLIGERNFASLPGTGKIQFPPTEYALEILTRATSVCEQDVPSVLFHSQHECVCG